MRTALNFVGCFAIVALLAASALAHGGTYTGPGGGGAPGYSGPGGGGTTGPDPGNPNPGGPGGGTTPPAGGGGGTTGPSGGGGPAPVRPGGGRAVGGTGGRTGGVTPGRAKAKTDDDSGDWDGWWDLNDDGFLLLKSKVRSSGGDTTNRDNFLGDDSGIKEVTTSKIRKEITPTLKLACKDPYYDARAGAVIALGKVADKSNAEIVRDIVAMLADTDKIVKESACLALGLLGDKAAVPDLLELAKNTPRGKKLAGADTGDVPTRMRCFASVAVGLIGAREPFTAEDKVLDELITIAKTDVAHKDIQIGPALALQLVNTQIAAPQIMEVFKNVDADKLLRAHLGVALGKIGYKAAVPELLKGLSDKESYVAYSSAIALGLLATKDDKDTVSKLISFAKGAPVRGVKNFSIIALGETGDPRAKAELLNFVEKGQTTERTFAALALGVMASKFGEGKEESGPKILEAYKSSKNDPEKAAYAISLALMGYNQAIETLRADLTAGSGSQVLKGHLCTALGLLSDRDSIPGIQELVKQKGDQDLRKRAAVALGLLRDPSAVDVLQKVIQESASSKAILGAATVALGYIGDDSAVAILRDMIENKKGEYQDVTRAFATVALGFLGDKDDIPFLSRLHKNSNYLALSEALQELLSIL